VAGVHVGPVAQDADDGGGVLPGGELPDLTERLRNSGRRMVNLDLIPATCSAWTAFAVSFTARLAA
jgi:hypothetical protein